MAVALPHATLDVILWAIYKDKFRAREDSQNRCKAEGIEYTDAEIAKSRTLFKCTNGGIFTVDIFKEMYPDAVLMGLVRNGFAVIEGYLRRNCDLEKTARQYELGMQRAILYDKQLPNFYIIRFEEILHNPLKELQRIYDLCYLDRDKVTKIRMETKAVISQSGQHRFIRRGPPQKRMVWTEPDELPGFLSRCVRNGKSAPPFIE